MFTDCPTCGRQFRVQAHHLSAAAGQVRCGFCGRQFDALTRLRDSPLPQGRMQSPEPVSAEPEFHIPGTEPEPHPLMYAPASGTESEPEPEREPEPEPEPEPEREAEAEPETEAPAEVDEMPVQLLPESTPKSRGGVRFLWGLGVVLLLAAGAAQGAWFNRDALLARFPRARPWAKLVCERMHCSVQQHRDLSAIKVISRDVRQHPRYRNSLLVNATIANSASYTQPFPTIRLMLFDTNGRVVAWRDFEPKEYLDASMNVQHGMAPGVPVHFVLEVTGATQGAVSFEFGFL